MIYTYFLKLRRSTLYAESNGLTYLVLNFVTFSALCRRKRTCTSNKAYNMVHMLKQLDHVHIPGTSNGLFGWTVFPTPNWPSLLSPQHFTPLFAMRAHVCISPPVGHNVCVCVSACYLLSSVHDCTTSHTDCISIWFFILLSLH
jgi:hypothetical protein